MTRMDRPAVLPHMSETNSVPYTFLIPPPLMAVQLTVCTADRAGNTGQKKAFLILKIEAYLVSLSVILSLHHD